MYGIPRQQQGDVLHHDLGSDRESALAAIENDLHDVANLLHSKLGVTVRPTMSDSDHESKLFISRVPVLKTCRPSNRNS